MNHEKTLINILKCIVVCVGIASLFTRCVLEAKYINTYMAFVNIISFIISVNILLLTLYSKLRKKYSVEKEKNNILKITKMKNKVMIVYIMIFVLNVIMLILLAIVYFFIKSDKALCNDLLGISSLILAIAYDVMDDILVEFIINVNFQ